MKGGRQPYLKWDKERVAQLRLLVAAGHSNKDIAEMLGTTENNITQNCSRFRILRTHGDAIPGHVIAHIDPADVPAIQRAAEERNTTINDLIAKVISAVAQDGLFTAVLD